jgi:subtilisin family serine protease/CheY-like chemotaxis protein
MTLTIDAELAPTVIHVEDEPGWQKAIQDALQHSGIPVREIVTARAVDEVIAKMESTSGPLVVVMDLRCGGDDEINYDGYEWLLTSMPEFVRAHASVTVFVVSGQLHEGIIATLRGRGIPAEHVFEKGKWADNRGLFVAQVRDFLEYVDEAALRHLAGGVSGSKMDPHVLHAISAHNRRTAPAEPNSRPERFPLLIQVADVDSWRPETVRDLEILDQVETIFAVRATLESIADLERDTNVIHVEYSRPARMFDCERSVPFVKGKAVHEKFGESGDSCLIGIIDDGVDVLHPTFLDEEGNSRIVALWDQRDPTGPAPRAKRGTLHTAEQISEYVRKNAVPPALKSMHNSHGTHVASIAAGRATDHFAGGVAHSAKIAVVIPSFEVPAGERLSLGYSHGHMFALNFLKAEAKRRSLPLVINVSLGMNAGAHDGTSLLEKTCDEVTRQGVEPGIVIIKSAGNERNHHGHALVRMTTRSREVLRWHSQEVSRQEDSLEAWFAASDRLRFRVVDPYRKASEWVGWKKAAAEGELTGGVYYNLTFVSRVRENGDSRCVMTLTAPPSGLITAGEWQLEIEAADVRDGAVHVWLERYAERATEFLNHVSEEMTLSIPATAHYVVSVGAVGSSVPLKLADYSSYGPTRDGRKKPELVAPGEEVIAAVSLPRHVEQFSGTSQAAPHVAGSVALLLSSRAKQKKPQYNAAQIQKALTQLVQHPGAHWHPGLGYGLLDAEEFFRAMS